MKYLIITAQVSEDGTAILEDDRSENVFYQSFTNAFEMGKIRAEKFIAERTVEKGIIAKKELHEASRNS